MHHRGRGAWRGRGRGRGRGSDVSSRPARSGIRTRGGTYKKFDSQRVREVEDQPDQQDESSLDESSEADGDEDDLVAQQDGVQPGSYAALLQSLKTEDFHDARPSKRRRIEHAEPESESISGSSQSDDEDELAESVSADSEVDGQATRPDDSLDHALSDGDAKDDQEEGSEDLTEINQETDLYQVHFTHLSGGSPSSYGKQHSSYRSTTSDTIIAGALPPTVVSTAKRLAARSLLQELPVKPRLQTALQAQSIADSAIGPTLAPYVLSYADVLLTHRTPGNAAGIRQIMALHAVNHVLSGRDRVIKNNARLAQADDDSMLEFRDQGFTRPKVLILAETRQMCARYADAIVALFQPEQQENKQRFQDSFTAPTVERDMPDDYLELFEGNNDNNFLTTIKFTRKTLKFFSAFYQSDIILASPLGLRRILQNEDKKKRDYDFLSSIEVVIVDQADAMQMQSWENVELVFRHLNLQPKELRDCDVTRVRHWYLDGQARHLRQTILLSAYLTPEINRLFSSELQNIAGKVKISEPCSGAIQAATGLGMKQIFSRFPSRSPLEDPDARFKFFTSSVLPSLLRIPRPSDGGQGILIFIPSYFDFLRVRNFFATSTMTENVSFGTINDYSERSEQRRARSHFLTGKHSVLLYTQRAHHFFRLRLRGVKRVIMYGLPENPIFYSEIVAGFIGTSLEAGVGPGECMSRSMFSKFDALSMERIVGTDRVKSMVAGSGDTFEFV